MTSINGLKNIAATSIQNSGEIYLGNDIDVGTAGQALVSGGPNQPARWDVHTGTIQPLTMGTDLSLASGNTTFDGSIPDTINAAGHGFGSGGAGIDISGSVITTDNDGTTINNSGGTGAQNQVLKVPNDLTISQNGTTIDTFNGSSAKTINLEGKYSAGDGIEISGHTIPVIEADTDEVTISKNVGGAEKLQVLKVPNALTAGTNVSFSSGTTYDGSAAITISSTDTDTQLNLTAALPMVVNNLGGLNREVELQYDINTLAAGGGALEVAKVPNSLTAGSNINFSSGTTFDGSSAITISSTDTNTQLALVADPGIDITSTGGLNRTIGAKVDGTTVDFDGDDLTVKKVPNALTAGSNITFSSGTTYDGSAALTINASSGTTYQGGTGISINTATNPDTINCQNIPNSALANSTISGKSLGTSLANLTFYSSSGAFITSYNGADPPTSVVLDGNTQLNLTQGANIVITNTGGLNRTIAVSSAPTNLDLSSSTNTFPNFVGGSEILKSMSYIDNSAQNFNRIFNTSNEFFFSGSQDSGSDTLEIDFTATSTTGYCEYGFYANTLTGGLVFCVGIAAATGGTSPFATTLTSSPVAIDAYKIGLFDGTTSTYSLKEILDFTSFENTYITSKFFFNNLTVGTRYRMALYGRCFSSGSLFINAGGKNTTGFASRSFHQPAFMKFYEYDSTIGGARTTGSGGGGGM